MHTHTYTHTGVWRAGRPRSQRQGTMRDEGRLGTRINQNAQISWQNRRQRHTQIQLLQLRTPYAIVDTVQLGGCLRPERRGQELCGRGTGAVLMAVALWKLCWLSQMSKCRKSCPAPRHMQLRINIYAAWAQINGQCQGRSDYGGWGDTDYRIECIFKLTKRIFRTGRQEKNTVYDFLL